LRPVSGDTRKQDLEEENMHSRKHPDSARGRGSDGLKQGPRNRRRFRRLWLERLEERAMLATVLWDGGGNGTSWNDPLNWDGDALPTAADDVVIGAAGGVTITYPAGTTTVKSVQSEAGLHIAGGSLTVAGTSYVNGPLTVASGASLVATGAGVTLAANASVVIDGAILSALAGATINLPAAQKFTSGRMTIEGTDATIYMPNLTNIDNSRFTLSGGATYTAVATSYSATSLTSGSGNFTLFSVQDAGTVLDLSSITDFDDSFSRTGAGMHTIIASNGGRIDLSNVRHIKTPKGTQHPLDLSDKRLDVVVNTGGMIELEALQSFTAGGRDRVRLQADAGSWEFPALVSADGVIFDVPTDGVYTAPNLASARYGRIRIGSGGTLSVPNLKVFTWGVLGLGANQTLNAPAFEDIEQSQFFLSGGAHYAVAATSYSATCMVPTASSTYSSRTSISQTNTAVSGTKMLASPVLSRSGLPGPVLDISCCWANPTASSARFGRIPASWPMSST
jgi:hypothetical protein